MSSGERWPLPVWWWGPLRSDQTLRTVDDLIAQGVLDQATCDRLAMFIALGASVIVCAGPSGSGKTTLLTSLMPFVAPTRQSYFVRGSYDPLTDLDQSDPSGQVILINEISPHLPIYLWGANARQVFDAGQRGAQLLATAHAETPESLIHQLMAYPTNATIDHLQVWDLVIFLNAWRTPTSIHREIRSIVSLSGVVDQGIRVEELAGRSIYGESLIWDETNAAALMDRLRVY
jgi:Flp pilus assembly CpaF family ATPase